jgi:Fe-S-cluster containining protein
VSNLFNIGPPTASSPCVANRCTVCCHDTNMPLTMADLERITSQGYALDDFSQPDTQEGYLRLRNTQQGACFFLEPDGRCRVQAVKPEGCRLYPFIYDEQNDRAVRDDICPFNGEFNPPPGVERQVRALIVKLEGEARARRSHPGRGAP